MYKPLTIIISAITWNIEEWNGTIDSILTRDTQRGINFMLSQLSEFDIGWMEYIEFDIYSPTDTMNENKTTIRMEI